MNETAWVRLMRASLEAWSKPNSHPPISKVGICGNLHFILTSKSQRAGRYYMRAWDPLLDLMVQWPHFSGDPEYPIPSPTPDYSARKFYEATEEKWYGRSGELRRDLCAFLAPRIEQRLLNERK